MKKCTECNEVKELDKFHRHKISKDGRRPKCKICRNSKNKHYYEKNKDKVLKRQNKYQKENHEKVLRYQKEYYEKNKNRVNKRNRNYYKNNKEELLEWHEEYHKNNKDKINNRHKQHYKDNKHIYLAKDKKRRLSTERASFLDYMGEVYDFYKNCPKGHHVDHIIPINHPDVCGLHVPWNLQYLPAEENLKKSNKFDGTINNEGWR